MRIVIVRDGRTSSVEVAPGVDAVTVGSERYPVTVVRETPTSVELEIAGERVVVENWPEHFPSPPGSVDVNGERWTITLERGSSDPGPATARPPAGPAAPAPSPGRASPARAGTPVVPPMPGKVIEVRVAEGGRVRRGDVLLVLEAMKMRNEITSPVDGVVRGLSVAPGANDRTPGIAPSPARAGRRSTCRSRASSRARGRNPRRAERPMTRPPAGRWDPANRSAAWPTASRSARDSRTSSRAAGRTRTRPIEGTRGARRPPPRSYRS